MIKTLELGSSPLYDDYQKNEDWKLLWVTTTLRAVALEEVVVEAVI